MKKVVIVGSYRNDGDTKNLTDLLIKKSNWTLIDLNDYNFSYFDYEHKNATVDKDLGRKLRGKNMAAISCSNGNNLSDKFWLPFSETAKYLGMEYLGNIHAITGKQNDLKLEEFINQIENLNLP